MSRRIDSEDDLIARFLAPLSAGFPGARGLLDDCATLAHEPGEELVLTTDAVAEGVHFLPDERPEDIAWKALAVNVSDLAAKGATPVAYLMALSLPEAPEEQWLRGFADGLRLAQERFSIALAGGDTDRRPGPLSVTITAVGRLPQGAMVPRGAARPGDRIFASGTLGDAALGLALRRDPDLARSWALDDHEQRLLLERYARPEPRLALAPVLRALASAAMDISDGLAKDLGRMCRASGCGAVIQASRIALSGAASKVVSAEPVRMQAALGGGDDYEILAAISPDKADQFAAEARRAGTEVREIGVAVEGRRVEFMRPDGSSLRLDRPGWDHFAVRGV